MPHRSRGFPRLIAALAAAALAVGCVARTAHAQTPSTLGLNERPIHDAARTGTKSEVARLLAADAAQRDARTPLDATPLHYAAMNPDPGPLQALLAAGADPNARDRDGQTPLHMAAFATRTEHAKRLLRAGADPTLKTASGRDVASMARKARADEVAGVVSLWILQGCSVRKPC